MSFQQYYDYLVEETVKGMVILAEMMEGEYTAGEFSTIQRNADKLMDLQRVRMNELLIKFAMPAMVHTLAIGLLPDHIQQCSRKRRRKWKRMWVKHFTPMDIHW